MIRVSKGKMGKKERFYSLKYFAVRQESAKLSSWVQFPSSPYIFSIYSVIVFNLYPKPLYVVLANLQFSLSISHYYKVW